MSLDHTAMKTPAPKLTLRHTTLDDLPKMLDIVVEAAMQVGYSDILFPERLEPDAAKRRADERAFHRDMHVRGMNENKDRAYICVEIEDEAGIKEIGGWASWFTILEDKPREGDGKSSKPPPPASFDADFISRRNKVAEAALEKALGKDGTVGMYTCQPLAVASKHQRKGVGTMLLNWGVDKAREEGKDIQFGASRFGLHMYQKAGFETIGLVEGFGSADFSLVSLRTKPA